MSDLARPSKDIRRTGIRELPLDAIAGFCQKRHIRKLALFGSVLREDFNAESDIDVLVEYKANHIPGLEFFSHQEELSRILHRNVDLNTPESLSKYFRDEVLREAVARYAEA
jgi:predicted nucleotidyltransferase